MRAIDLCGLLQERLRRGWPNLAGLEDGTSIRLSVARGAKVTVVENCTESGQKTSYPSASRPNVDASPRNAKSNAALVVEMPASLAEATTCTKITEYPNAPKKKYAIRPNTLKRARHRIASTNQHPLVHGKHGHYVEHVMRRVGGGCHRAGKFVRNGSS